LKQWPFGHRPQAATITTGDNLWEYLEAEFYLKATRNATLVEVGVISESDTTGPTTGEGMVPDFGSHPSGFSPAGCPPTKFNT
jgi:hypothetical protein